MPFRCSTSWRRANCLPSHCRTLANRQLILFYESAEGGAGVLRQLVDDPRALSRVAREALQLCHFDPDTGADQRRAPSAREDCEAACYDCLMSYSNQREHDLLDRQKIRELLAGRLASAQVVAAPAELPRAEHLEQLVRLTGSELETRWLRWVNELELRLPTRGQVFVEDVQDSTGFPLRQSSGRRLHRWPAARLPGTPSPRPYANGLHGRPRLHGSPLWPR